MSNLVINLSYNKSFFKFVGIYPIKMCTEVESFNLMLFQNFNINQTINETSC